MSSDDGAARGDGSEAANLAHALLNTMPSDEAVELLRNTLKQLLPHGVEADFVHAGPPPPSPPPSPSPAKVLPNAKKAADKFKKRPGSGSADKSEQPADEAEGLSSWPAPADEGGSVREEPSLDQSGRAPEWEDSGGGALDSPQAPAESPSMVHQSVKLPARQDSKRISIAPAAEPAASPVTPSAIGLASAGKSPHMPHSVAKVGQFAATSNYIANAHARFQRQDTVALQQQNSRQYEVQTPDHPGEDEDESDSDGDEAEAEPSSSPTRVGPYMLGANQPAIEGTSPSQPPSPEMSEKRRKKQAAKEAREAKQAEDREAELAKVKAMTMHDMIETVEPENGREKKILFLTGPQATMITENEKSLHLLLERFDVGTPQLVINLLESGGFGEWTRTRPKDSWGGLNLRWAPGVIGGVAPFATTAEERAAEYRIDLFMANVLIPLAAETHAVVICCAIPGLCILSSSFTRMFQAVKAKWVGKPPFTVLSTTNDMIAMYSSGKHDAKHNVLEEKDPKGQPLRYKGTEWFKVMGKTKAWKERHKIVEKTLEGMTKYPLYFDLDKNAVCYLIVDDGGSGQFSTLITALTRSLASSRPSLAIKTGSSRKRPLGFKDPSTLEVAADSANSGTPTLFLDVRPVDRDVYLKAKSRLALIHKAQQFLERREKKLRGARGGIVDTFDACAIALFHEILTGDGDPATEEIRVGGRNQDVPTPLHKAIKTNIRKQQPKKKEDPETRIKEAEKELGVDLDGDGDIGGDQGEKADGPVAPRKMWDVATAFVAETLDFDLGRKEKDEGDWKNEPATPQQLVAAADWLTDYFFRNGYEVLPEGIPEKKEGEDFESHGRVLYREQMLAMSVATRTLLASPNFYHINLTNHSTAKRLVEQLVKLDRLPQENPLEGLLLLRSAWRDYDVAMLLAERYKRVCKVSFCLQLFLGWLAVTSSALSSSLEQKVQRTNDTAAASSSTADSGTSSKGRMLSEASQLISLPQEGVLGWLQVSLVHLIFAFSVAMTFIIAFDSILNSHGRWKQLRIGAGALESIIWKYRTRTGAFEIDDDMRSSRSPRLPETTLLQAIKMTRTNMLASANLSSSEFTKRYSKRVYKHFQDDGEPKPARGPLPADAEAVHFESHQPAPIDDHQSPTQPSKYIALRLEPAITFYQKRIPKYARRATAMRLLVVLLGIGASALARYEQVFFVILVTSAAAAATSWSEFADTQRKTERYTRSVQGLRDLLDWWRSLGEVEKASKTVISQLVNGTESIINAEQTAWTSTPASEGEEGKKDREQEEEQGEKGGGGKK